MSTKNTLRTLREEFKEKFGEDYIVSICENADAKLGAIWSWILKNFKEKEGVSRK